ncbi:Cyclopropane-fatty-acyl-phospholipid synthase [Sodalis praecaptivus]
MSSSCVEDLSFQDNAWYRIVHELLAEADIEINRSRSFDIRVDNPDFLSAYYRTVHWV